MNKAEEKISELETRIAVLTEKVKRLEWIIYGVIGVVFLQLAGLFVLWAKQVMNK